MADNVVRQAIAGAERLTDDGSGDGDCSDLGCARLPRNDIGNGERFRRRFGSNVTNVTGAGWHCYDGARHKREMDDPPPNVMQRVHDMVAAIQAEADALQLHLKEDREAQEAGGKIDSQKSLEEREKADAEKEAAHRKWGISSGNSARIDGALRQARPYLTRDVEQMDPEPFVINCANGTLDLWPEPEEPPDYDGCSDEGLPPPILRPHRRADLITRLAPVKWNPAATGAKWQAFLEMIQPEEEMRLYLQRLAGYTATGDAGEQVFAVLWGDGKNGKSTFVQALLGVLGDYCATVDPRAFMAGGQGQDASKPNPTLAKLRPIRFVSASEPSEDAKLGEDLIKTVTGGNRISVRDLFQAEMEYRPRWKLWFDTNHKPVIRGMDLGIWRRVHLVAFTETVPPERRVKDYHEILIREEGEAIFRWIVDGARAWKERGLDPPDSVSNAVDEYKRQSDPLFDFLDSCCFEEPNAAGPTATDLYRAYVHDCELNGKTPVTQNRFGRLMTNRGRPARKVEGVNRYKGLRLLDNAVPDAGWMPGGGAKRGRDGGGQSGLL